MPDGRRARRAEGEVGARWARVSGQPDTGSGGHVQAEGARVVVLGSVVPLPRARPGQLAGEVDRVATLLRDRLGR